MKNFLGRGGGTAPPQTLPQWGDRYIPSHAPPPWRLRHLDPSHSKILGTSLKGRGVRDSTFSSSNAAMQADTAQVAKRSR